jgi:hypothetical protein
MRSSASSNLIISSPILARANVSSRSSGSPRIRSPRGPCSRNTRFQLSSSWAGTRLSGETPSSASLRRTRNTSSVLRAALHRSGRSGASTAGGSLPRVGFRFALFIVDLLGCRHRSRDGVQRDRVRFTMALVGGGLDCLTRSRVSRLPRSLSEAVVPRSAVLQPGGSCGRAWFRATHYWQWGR